MQKTAMRITCAFLLLTIALASGAGLIGSVFAGPAEESAVPLNSPEVKEPLVLVKLLILADKQVREVTLTTPDGDVLQVLTPDAQGMAVTQPLEPGKYIAQTTQGSAVFTLLENASVAEVSGCGWTDGEQLHLTAGSVGTLTVRRTVEEGEAAFAGGWLDYTLSNAGYYDRAVVRCPEHGRNVVSCTFYGIPYGKYVLSENGRQCAEVLIGAGREEVSVLLP